MCFKVFTTTRFDKWFKRVKDKKVRFRIEARLSQLVHGNFGDHKMLTQNIGELRFFFGGGIRIYYTVRDEKIVLLLNGGSKSSQSRDIELAKALSARLEGSDGIATE